MRSALGTITGGYASQDYLYTLGLPNTVAVFDPADTSRLTTVGAAVANPTNLTLWTKVRCANTTADTIVTDAGTTTTYYVQQDPISGLQQNHSVRAILRAKSGSLTHARFVVAAHACIVHTDDGTVHSADADVTCTPLGAEGGGWYRWQMDIAFASVTATYSQIMPCNSAGAFSFTSAGGDTVGAQFVSIDQANSSLIASPVGTLSLAQATPASRPQVAWTNGTLYSPVAVAGYWPVLFGDGTDDSISGVLTGLSQPFAIFACAWWASEYSAASVLWGSNAFVNAGQLWRSGATTLTTSSHSGTMLVRTVATPQVPHAYCCATNGASSGIYQDTVLSGALGDAGSDAPDLFNLFSNGGLAPSRGGAYVRAIYIVSGVPSAATHAKFYAWCQRNGGVT
jgi:hypothetical protein